MSRDDDDESQRLADDARRQKNWKRWGPYLSERQWGTVREDYSENGECWTYFPHDHARSRAYRWGEDGLLGICDREGRLCFALALWNERDPILKERLFGLTGPEGNHGEDVKESYFYLDATPTSSYLKALYKYPQGEFPYSNLVAENARRGKADPEYELADTGAFDGNRYFDILAEYAKAGPDDILARFTLTNRGPDAARLHVLPTLWFRNTWAWGRTGEGYWPEPRIQQRGPSGLDASHASLGGFSCDFESLDGGPALLFTDNETNCERIFGGPSKTGFAKDAFHEHLIAQRRDVLRTDGRGTKAAAHYRLELGPGQSKVIRVRLKERTQSAGPADWRKEHDAVFASRLKEADAFYANHLPTEQTRDERAVSRQAYAGLLWSKQFYAYDIRTWLEGDPGQPTPPEARKQGRNWDWKHLYNRDVISMPDKWEYPWYAAWDLAFHMLPLARVDPDFAKHQLVLFLREWYMHPNGQLPAYEFAFSDVNPPVHAWAAWRVYKIAAARGHRDLTFLSRVFQKLLINFTWWVNRKDEKGNNLFSGGFLGLDNIGVFDRSRPLPTGGHLEQADGTAWMAFYCATMLSIALELARANPAYDDLASKFFEHFIGIADAINTVGGTGLWDEEDGFYYDQLNVGGRGLPLRVRSMVGVIPLIAVEVLEDEVIDKLPHFKRRMQWFLSQRTDLAKQVSFMSQEGHRGHYLIAIPTRARLERVLKYLLDEREFLSPFGLRSLSRIHKDKPYIYRTGPDEFRVDYAPGESSTGLFGGNSNWRGPVWFPVNYLLVEALQRYWHFYGDDFKVECPTGSGKWMHLGQVSLELARRMSSLFLPDASGRRPCHGGDPRYATDPHWKDLVLFHEYFHAENGRGVGASHQTGWTALVTRCLEDLAVARKSAPK